MGMGEWGDITQRAQTCNVRDEYGERSNEEHEDHS